MSLPDSKDLTLAEQCWESPCYEFACTRDRWSPWPGKLRWVLRGEEEGDRTLVRGLLACVCGVAEEVDGEEEKEKKGRVGGGVYVGVRAGVGRKALWWALRGGRKGGKVPWWIARVGIPTNSSEKERRVRREGAKEKTAIALRKCLCTPGKEKDRTCAVGISQRLSVHSMQVT